MKLIQANIDQLSDLIADERAYPARNGYRDPSSPAFIFRDERDIEEDSDTLWGRELALDFEEWVAKQDQREQYLIGSLMPAFMVTTRKEVKVEIKPTKSDAPFEGGIRPSPERAAEYKRCMTKPITKWEAATEIVLATMSEIEEWMDKPTKDKSPVMVSRGPDGELVEWSPKTPAESQAYFERQESREFANWLLSWHRRRPANNDHWRRFVAPLANVLDDKVMGITAKTILQTMRDTLPFAPGPVGDTIFRNPDGTRAVTRIAPGNAKAGFKARHGLDEELITMDRVQYEGERQSRYVIGTRKASDKTASSYYDPDPVKGDRGYVPRACTLIRIPESKVMPDSHCYRLTIRELERAIIAGADLCEDEVEAYGATFEDAEFAQFDTREAGLAFDDSCDFRTLEAMDEQSQWLYWLGIGNGLEGMAQTLLLRNPGNAARYLPGLDGACLKLGTDEPLTDDEEIAMELLMQAKDEDDRELEKTGRIQWSRYDLLRTLE